EGLLAEITRDIEDDDPALRSSDDRGNSPAMPTSTAAGLWCIWYHVVYSPIWRCTVLYFGGQDQALMMMLDGTKVSVEDILTHLAQDQYLKDKLDEVPFGGAVG
ncbi:hypothetical protein EV182_004338, partial [Spiromyces aspiralis]